MTVKVDEAPMTEPLHVSETGIAARGIERRFGDVVALAGLELEVGAGEVVGVVGPSGCGKSTLLELVAGLSEPDAGEVVVRAPGLDRRDACALMPQRDLLLPWRDGLGNAALALEAGGVRRREARRRAKPLFERFGLAGFEGARPAELSGGMRQRVAFIRTLLAERPILLLDEPFAALDAITRAEMQEWLAAALVEEPRTTLLVTHDVEEALFICDRVLVLSPRPGRVVRTIDVPARRPRDRTQTIVDPEFAALRLRALEALR